MTREASLRLSLLLVLLLVAPAYAGDVFSIPAGFADGILGHEVRIVPEGKPPEDIGRVIDVLVNTQGNPVAAVLDVGGFLGVGNRKVAVTWSALEFAPAKDGLTITLAVDAASIRAAPDYKGPNRPVQAVSP